MDVVFNFWGGYLLDSEYQMLVLSFWALIAIEFFRYGLSSIVTVWNSIFSQAGRRSSETLRNEGKIIAASGLSVVIATHNNGEALKQTLQSIKHQTVQKLQLIIINDGSNDDTGKICEELVQTREIDNYINLKSRGGKSAALNAGATVAKYPYLLFADAGTTFHDDAFEIALGYFNDPEVGAVSGNVSVRNQYDSMLAYMQKINYLYAITFAKRVFTVLNFPFVISGAFGIYRKEIFDHIGGYHPGTGEDAELAILLNHLGWRVEFAIHAISLTDVPTTLKSLWTQRLRWDRDMIRIMHQEYTPLLHKVKRRKFNISTAMGMIDTNLMEVFYIILLYFYLVFFFWIYGEVMIYYLIAIYFFFCGFQLFFFSISMLSLLPEDRDWEVLYFVPLYILFQQFLLNPIRLWGYYSEVFGHASSYDEFVPKKVREKLRAERRWRS